MGWLDPEQGVPSLGLSPSPGGPPGVLSRADGAVFAEYL